jgi:hypothetical protein
MSAGAGAPTPVPAVSDAVSLIARKQAVVPTVSLQRFDNHRIVLRPGLGQLR